MCNLFCDEKAGKQIRLKNYTPRKTSDVGNESRCSGAFTLIYLPTPSLSHPHNPSAINNHAAFFSY